MTQTKTLFEILKQKDSQILEFWTEILNEKGFVLQSESNPRFHFHNDALEVTLDLRNPFKLEVTHMIEKKGKKFFLNGTIRKEDIEDGILDVLC